ncbi:MAG: acyltransferase family protein [Muribaculaceae bacterium]|nr:acyltransferase family protein [Muribaculaceae bacterium]
MKYVDINFSRPQTEIMRGVSIIFIMLHNLLHLYPGVLRESEFFYDFGAISKFGEILGSGNLLAAWENIISFLGWYGVPMFIFLSGFGLSKRYDGKPFETWAFIKRNWLKLVTLMSIGVFIFCVDQFITILSQEHPQGWKIFLNFLIPLTCLNDLVQFRLDSIPGVYWYFGLAFELYVIYALYLRIKSGGKVKNGSLLWGMTAICFIAVPFFWNWPFGFDPIKFQTYLRHNFVGWMLPFAAGIWIARNPRQPLWGVIALCIVSVALFVPSLYSVWSWQLTSIFAVVIIAGISIIFSKIPVFGRFWIWTGQLSAYLFVAHPIVRHLSRFWTFGDPDLMPVSVTCMLYVIAVFLAAILYRIALRSVKAFLKLS